VSSRAVNIYHLIAPGIEVLSHELKRLRGENKGKDEGQASDLSSVRSAPSKMLFCCLESGSIGIEYHSKTSLKM